MTCAEPPLTARTRESGVHLCARRIEGTTPRPNPAPQQANAWARPRTEWQKRTPHACSSTRTRHRPGAPSDKGRRTRRSRCLRGSESGDSLWLLEVDKGVVSCASCGFGVAGRRHSPPLPTAPPDLHELRTLQCKRPPRNEQFCKAARFLGVVCTGEFSIRASQEEPLGVELKGGDLPRQNHRRHS